VIETVGFLQGGVPPNRCLVPIRPGPHNHPIRDGMFGQSASDLAIRSVDNGDIPLLPAQLDAAIPEGSNIKEGSNLPAAALFKYMRVHQHLVIAAAGRKSQMKVTKELHAASFSDQPAVGVIGQIPIAIQVRVKGRPLDIPSKGHVLVGVGAQLENPMKDAAVAKRRILD
jgi:hypothetical protein